VRHAFGAFGQVASVTIHKYTFRDGPIGFGFVAMSTEAEAESVIDGLNGTELRGGTLIVMSV